MKQIRTWTRHSNLTLKIAAIATLNIDKPAKPFRKVFRFAQPYNHNLDLAFCKAANINAHFTLNTTRLKRTSQIYITLARYYTLLKIDHIRYMELCGSIACDVIHKHRLDNI